jgi:hypothetical protein
MSIAFPNVPFAKGVPVIARSPSINYVAQAYLGVAESFLIDQIFPTAKWGLYNTSGEQLIDVDNVVSISFKQDSRVSNFPVESGKFASYNKVGTPYTSTIRISKGGSISERATVLNKIADLCASTALNTIITPEGSYLNANLVTYDYTRTNNLLVVDLQIQEIRQVSPSYARISDANNPASHPSQSNGITQAPTATSAQSTSFKTNTVVAANYLKSANTSVQNYIKNLF